MSKDCNRDTKTCRMVAEDIVCISESLRNNDIEEMIWRLTENEYTPYNILKHHDIDIMYKEAVERFGEKYSLLEKDLAAKYLAMLIIVNPEDDWVA